MFLSVLNRKKAVKNRKKGGEGKLLTKKELENIIQRVKIKPCPVNLDKKKRRNRTGGFVLSLFQQ